MIVRLNPEYKFICDRCGKQKLVEQNEGFEAKVVEFTDAFGFELPRKKRGQVCKDCYEEFWWIAENFFAEENYQSERKRK